MKDIKYRIIIYNDCDNNIIVIIYNNTIFNILHKIIIILIVFTKYIMYICIYSMNYLIMIIHFILSSLLLKMLVSC